MGVAHQRLANDLGLQMEHFDVVLELLGASLLDLHISQASTTSFEIRLAHKAQHSPTTLQQSLNLIKICLLVLFDAQATNAPYLLFAFAMVSECPT